MARECRIARFFGNKHLGRSLKGKHSWSMFFTFPQHRLFVLFVFVQSFPATEFWLASARNFRTLSFWVIWWGLLNERMRINYKWSHFWAPHCKRLQKTDIKILLMFSHLSRFCKDVLPSKRYDPTKEKTPKSSNSKRLLLKAWFPHHRYNHYDLEKNVQRSYEKPATAIAATIWKTGYHDDCSTYVRSNEYRYSRNFTVYR